MQRPVTQEAPEEPTIGIPGASQPDVTAQLILGAAALPVAA